MNLETITMNQTEAKRAFIEYRNAVRAKHSDEDAEIMRGYKALAKGQQLISLQAAIRAGGCVETRRGTHTLSAPRIAIARASAQWVWVDRSESGAVTFHEPRYFNSRQRVGIVRLEQGTLPQINWNQCPRGNMRAIVPVTPPRFRPAHALKNYHVLFEAEWEAVAPRDPALLKHIGGDLYAVLAVWDLTELERAVLMRRFEERS
jgi:hypothetical protein